MRSTVHRAPCSGRGSSGTGCLGLHRSYRDCLTAKQAPQTGPITSKPAVRCIFCAACQQDISTPLLQLPGCITILRDLRCRCQLGHMQRAWLNPSTAAEGSGWEITSYDEQYWTQRRHDHPKSWPWAASAFPEGHLAQPRWPRRSLVRNSANVPGQIA